MKYLNNEEKLWESKNKQLLLTTHRLREVDKSFFGSTIKSIMLEELTFCELRTTKDSRFLRGAVIIFLLLNGVVILLNHFLFKAEIGKLLFEDAHIGPDIAGPIFYLSIALGLTYFALFAFSIKKTFYFYTTDMAIEFQQRWLGFDERESFISKVEAAKDQRLQQLYQYDKKNMNIPANN
jgi:hypothetical protein